MLVADVTSFGDATWFDAAGDHHGDELHFVERYTRLNPDTLMYEATIKDPKVFTGLGKFGCRFACRRELRF